jgi:hypothetical protein
MNAATGDVIVGGASTVIVHVTNGNNETFIGRIGSMTVDMGGTVHAAQSMTFEGTPGANNFIVLNDAIDNGVGSIASNVLNTDGSRTVTFQDGAAIHFSNATLELPFNLGGGNIITAGGPPPDATIVGAATAHDLHLV